MGVLDAPTPRVTVNHGADATVARPLTTAPVLWEGSVQPNNLANGDWWLDTVDVFLTPVNAYNVVIVPQFNRPAATVGNWKTTFNSNAIFSGYTEMNPSAQNNSVSFDVALNAGTWEVTVMYAKNSDEGIAAVTLDGVSLGSIDAYNASALYNNLVSYTGIVVATGAVKRLTFLLDTKNASASNYGFRIQGVYFRRTA